MKGNIGKKFLSLFLSAVMVLGMLPTAAFATEGEGTVVKIGPCEHHECSKEVCGFVEGVEGVDCTHTHDENCGYADAVEEVLCECTAEEGVELVHAEGCGYVEAKAEQPCTHECSKEACGYVEAVEAQSCTYACELCGEAEIVEEEYLPCDVEGCELVLGHPGDHTGMAVYDGDITEIDTVDELLAFAAAVNGGETFEGKTVKLMDDIDLSSVANWTPIGGFDASATFKGTFDGGNHTISNMTITKTDDASAKLRLGLFSYVENATIQNLTLKDSVITAESSDARASVLVMTVNKPSTISNVTVDGAEVNVTSGENGYATGVVGWTVQINMSDITVKNVELNVKATSTASTVRAGAIVAYHNQADSATSSIDTFKIENVKIDATGATTYVGGVFGYCAKGNQNTVGVGITNGTVDGLTIKSNATSASNVGGLIGMSYKVDPQKVDNVDITGLDIDFTGSSSKVGGVIGWDQSVSYNTSTKQGWYNDVHVTGTINENITSGSGSEVGGFVGVSHQYPKIYTNCSADVDVNTKFVGGGFTGSSCVNGWGGQYDTYINCSTSGDITAPFAGGFVAYAITSKSYIAMEDITVSGAIHGTTMGGGLISTTIGDAQNITIEGATITGNITGGTVAAVCANTLMASGNKLTATDVVNETGLETLYLPANASAEVTLYVEPIAEVNGEKFSSLQAAVDAADGDTVTLLKSASGAGVVIDKDVTIDFGGYTYSLTEGVGSAGTPSNGFQILEGSEVTLKNGTLEVAKKSADKFYILIQNYADLTVTGMTLDGTNLDKWSTTDGDSYVLSNNSGNVVINGETNIIANDQGADLAYAFDVCDKSPTYEVPNVTIDTTGKINGYFEVSAGLEGNLVIKNGSFTQDPTAYVPFGCDIASGNGQWTVTKADALVIKNKADLLTFAEMVNKGNNFKGEVVKLGNDINLYGVEWSPIGGDSVYFAGEFDGQDYTIYNLTQTQGARMGLFGLVEKAYIHDLTLANVNFTVGVNDARVGALAGNLQNWNVVKDVTIDGIKITLNGNDGLVGAVAGYAWKSQLGNVDVKNAEFIVNGTGNVIGGHTAYGRAHVWDTNVTGNNEHWLEGTVQTINGTEYVLQNYFVDCDVDGVKMTLNGAGSEAGGFIGSDTYNNHTNYFVDCHVTGLDVTAAEGTSQTVGGFMAWNNGTTSAGTVKGFENCSASGTITGANGIYGGFAGQVGGRACEYYNATADVDITCFGTAGGFVGATQAYSTHKYTFTDCTAKGDVTAAVAGGFVGKNGMSGDGKSVFVELNGCLASGAVKGTTYAGGLIGEVNTELPATNWNTVDSTGKLTLTNNTATAAANVSGGIVGYLIGYLDGVANGDAKEGNTVEVAMVGNTPDGSDVGTGTGHHINISEDTVKSDIINPVAQVDGTDYESLAEAVAAANAIEGGATVTLLKNVTLGEKLTITGDVTISGKHTITRADAYTGTLFAVNAGAKLTLDGGLTIDGNNEWVMDMTAYEADLEAMTQVLKENAEKYFTPEEGAPVATAYMIVLTKGTSADAFGGTVNLNDVTIQNNYSINSGIVNAAQYTETNLTGAKISHVAATQASGVVVNASGAGIKVNMNEGTVIDGNHVGGNHGIFKIYSGTVFTMNGGEVKNTTGWNSNGNVVGLYGGTFIMNGGTICSNSAVYGPSNGRNAAIYLHSNSVMEMNGGTICHNTGRSRGGIDSSKTTSKLEITGGEVLDNISLAGNTTADVGGTVGTWEITGGTFTQDVSAWLAPDNGLVYDEEKGTYGLTKDLYEYNGKAYNSLADIIAAIKDNKARTAPVVKVLSTHKIDETIVIDTDLVLDLNGKTITTAATAAGDYKDAFTILADVTITGEGTVDARPSHGYTFYVGDKEGNAGNLTIENGKFYGETSVVNNRLGTVTINGGTYEVSLENADDTYDYVLNCIDENYTAGTAKIEVKGGKFHKFNPADNAAEGANTNFCAEGYKGFPDDDYFVVREDKDAMEAKMTITFNNNGQQMTLKYPSERYDTIQKLIGTNDYADFVFGAEQSELLAYVANGTASNIVITLHDDIELDAPINFYNKYYQLPVEYAITLDGNGHSITWADGYTGTLINVESGVSLTLEDVTIDGENAFTFYDDTTTVEDGQNWYTRFVNVGEEDKAVNANVIVNAGNLTLNKAQIKNVTIAADHIDGKTANTAEGGYYLKYNQDLAIIKSNGGKVTMERANISGNAGLVLNAVNAKTVLDNTIIDGNMGAGNKGGIIIANGGTMAINSTSICGNKAMARSATILGVINGAEVKMDGNSKIDNNKHIGVGSNTAGAMVVLEGASQFVMNGGSISNNVGGRAGAIASRWVGGTYGQHEGTSIVLNAGEIKGNTASNDSWNGASVFLRSPATIGKDMKIDGTIAVNAAPGELSITGGEFNGSLIVTDGLKTEITGGTFNYDPAEWLAENYGYDVKDGKYTVKYDPTFGKVAQIGEGDDAVLYESLKEALEACTNGETVKLIADITYDADDIVSAHGGATGFGKYDASNPSIIYLGGTKGATDAENQPSNVNAVLDLNGHTITNNADAYLFLIMDNAKVTFKDSIGTGKVVTTTEAPVIWSTGEKTLVTIESGEYVTANDEGLMWVTHSGDMVITGGEFSTTADDASLLIMLNSKSFDNPNYFLEGVADLKISGGTFHGFNPEKVMDDNTVPFTEFDGCAKGYEPIADASGNYTVVDYANWVKDELEDGKNVTLTEDIVVDGSYITSVSHAVNGNGKYPNYGIFTVVGDYKVTVDLNGYDITYEGHADFEWKGKTYNSCTVAHGLFFANGGADLTIKDSKGTSDVTVYGLASGAYVAAPNSKLTITGGTWKNEGCTECGGTNIFLYPLQGGELYITGGHFEQALDAEGASYLIVEHGGEYKNTVIDYSKTKVEISGGTFVGMNPGEIKKFQQTADNKLVTGETTDGCADGYIPVDKGNNTYGVKLGAYVAEVNGTKYESLQAAINAAKAGDTIKLLKAVTENVTVGKSLTIDGDSNNYTGNIKVNGNTVEATIKNVNFVDGTDYAIRTDTIKSITVEDCTVSNCGGFLYANKSTPTVSVKNVTVDGATYGFHWVYGTTATLENVKMTNVTTGLLIQNYAGKTINIKNCDITSIAIWERDGKSGVQTFNFEGVNTVDTLTDSQYAKYVGAQIVDTTKYGSLAAIVSEAQDGQTVKLISDIDLTREDVVSTFDNKLVLVDVVGKDITLDLNEKTITVNYDDSAMLYTVIYVEDGAGLTVENGTIDLTIGETKSGNYKCVVYMFWKRGTTGHLTINGGEYHANDLEDSMVYTNGNEIVTVKGGNFTLDELDDANSPWIFNVEGAGDHHVIVTGGTYNADINRQKWSNEVIVPETYYTTDNGDGTWTVNPGAVAYVRTGMLTGPHFAPKNIGYATFDEAITAALNFIDTPITLLDDYDGTYEVKKLPTYEDEKTGETVTMTLVINKNRFFADGVTAAEGIEKVEDNTTITFRAVESVAENTTTGVSYGSVAEALAAAKSGETVKLIKDAVEPGYLMVKSNVTLELNGNSLTADYLVTVKGAQVVDNADGVAKLIISADCVALQSNNAQMPLYDAENGCYKFFNTTVAFKGITRDPKTGTTKTMKCLFMPTFTNLEAYRLVAAGKSGTDAVSAVRWTGMAANNELTIKYKDSAWTEYATERPTNSDGYLVITLNGVDTVVKGGNIESNITVKSSTGVEMTSEWMVRPAQK